jgi:hypothetical protein
VVFAAVVFAAVVFAAVVFAAVVFGAVPLSPAVSGRGALRPWAAIANQRASRFDS